MTAEIEYVSAEIASTTGTFSTMISCRSRANYAEQNPDPVRSRECQRASGWGIRSLALAAT